MFRISSTGVLVALVVLSTPAAASQCVSTKDEVALQTRVVQSELMVAALSCEKSESYNSFVRMHQKQLMGAHKTLTAMFNREYGSAGPNQLNAFITRMANDASKRSLPDVRGFCSQADGIYQVALATPPEQLDSFISAQPVAHLHGFTPCTPTAATKASAAPANN